MGWRPRTLADVLGTRDVLPAPCCGRPVPADMLVDATTVPLAARPHAAMGLCDGCRERLFRSGTLTRAAFAQACGAPATVVAKLERAAAHRRRVPDA